MFQRMMPLYEFTAISRTEILDYGRSGCPEEEIAGGR
jgi:hypothetical protein